jgi:transcriptional regulator with XRE-family HTH domain
MASHLQNVSRNIRRRRESLGLSQGELAKLARKTNRFISMIETAPKDIRLTTLEDVAEALGCTIVELLGPVKDVPAKRKKDLKQLKIQEIPKTAVSGLDFAIKLLNQARKQAKN